MSGQVIPIIPKRVLDFAGLQTGSFRDVILGERISVPHWRQLTLGIRVHNCSITSGNVISIQVYAQSFTGQDPALQFVVAFPAAQITLNSSTPSPTFLVLGIPTIGGVCVADMARITAQATRNTVGAFTATVSLELSTKDG